MYTFLIQVVQIIYHALKNTFR